jgi:hypothetical protein
MRDTEDDDEVAEATEELLRDIGIQLTIAQLDSTAKPTGVGSIRRYYGRAGCSKTWYRRTQTSRCRRCSPSAAPIRPRSPTKTKLPLVLSL